MSDLVKRLREVSGGKLAYTNTQNHLLLSAADHIEALEAQLAAADELEDAVVRISDSMSRSYRDTANTALSTYREARK